MSILREDLSEDEMKKHRKQAERMIQSLLETTAKLDHDEFERLLSDLLDLDTSTCRALLKTSRTEGDISSEEVRNFVKDQIQTDRLPMYAEAEKWYFITTASFTDQAKLLAVEYPKLVLVDRNSLGEFGFNLITRRYENWPLFAKHSYDNRSRAMGLRQAASEAKALADRGKLDQALEVIYEMANRIESLGQSL
jgi:hypothetical protein